MGVCPQCSSFGLLTTLSLILVFMMNAITWNCRGVGSKSFPGLIRDSKVKYEASLFFLLETHISGDRRNEIIRRMGFDGMFVSEAQGHLGGIWCLWDTSAWTVVVQFASRQLVHLLANKNNEEPWFIKAVYGSPHRTLRQSLWDDLQEISSTVLLP